MIDAQREDRRRTEEAAGWFTQLNSTRISNESLDDFFAWRRDPLNRAAYERIESLSGLARTLRDHPEVRAAAREAMTRRPWWRALADALGNRRVQLYGGALAATLLATAVILMVGAQGERYSTGVGQQTTVSLADGSSVRLDTDSRLQVRFEKNIRKVTLERGQAFFAVAHDSVRPFIVDAGRAQVRAIGTRFDVRRAPQAVEVTLTQGRVRVTSKDAAIAGWTLAPGQQIRIDAHPAAAVPGRADLEAATAWVTGRIFFHDAPLTQAVAEVNRYTRKKIALAAGTPGGVRINGAFETGDVDGFVTAASESLDLAVAHRADGTVELQPRQPQRE